MAWQWIAAKCRGSSHEVSGTRLQDATACFSPVSCPDVLVGIVSDGAGSAEYGGEGAALICRTLSSAIRRHFALRNDLPSESEIAEWIDSARDRISAVAARRGKSPSDFAGTVVGAISTGLETLVFHVGDGCAVAFDIALQQWVALSWPQSGEFAATTFFVTDESGPKLRVTPYKGEVESVAIFSDGIERLALDFRVSEPSAKFFDGIVAPLRKLSGQGRDRELSAMLHEFLGSPPVLARTDDDKSLIVAVRR